MVKNFRLARLFNTRIVQNQNGFTILEVLIAVVIVGIISAAIALSIGTSSKVLVSANTQEVAKDIAAGDMEYIRSLPYADNYILLTSSSSTSNSGNPVTFRVVVTPGAATGTVAFKDGSSVIGTGTLSGGQTTFSTSSLSLGTHSITAVYSGDATYNSITSIVITQTVTASSTSPLLPGPINGNYTSSINVTYLRRYEQRIDITITWGGKTVFTLTDFRANY